MKGVVKKVIIYSLAGIMQVGLGATVIEASPLYNDDSQRIVQLDDRHDEHDRRQHEENRRHEREMRRHDHESERDWHERQERENRRHDDAMRDIEAFLLGAIIGSVVN
jgi:ABC-type Zn2+ transport system substrate-binding protein/surface adhesin